MAHFRSIVFSFSITVISFAIKIQNGSLQIKLLSFLSCFFFYFYPSWTFAWRRIMKRTKKKKKELCVSLEIQASWRSGTVLNRSSAFKLSEYDMICNTEVKTLQSWPFKNVTCLLYLAFRWVHERLPAVSLPVPF